METNWIYIQPSIYLGLIEKFIMMMKGLFNLLLCGLLFAGCTTQTPPKPEEEKPSKTVLGQTPKASPPEAPEDNDTPTLLLPTKSENTPKPVNIEYEEGSSTPFTGVKYAQFPDGKKMQEIPYLNGRKHGPEIRWYKNGKKYYEKSYWEGKLHGNVKEWDLKGELIVHEQWLRGKMEKKIL